MPSQIEKKNSIQQCIAGATRKSFLNTVKSLN